MAKTSKIEKKRKRNRKARTEVSPSPSASSSSSSSVPADTGPARDSSDDSDSAEEQQNSRPQSEVGTFTEAPENQSVRLLNHGAQGDSQAAFADFYLKQSTREFADDLEKLRSAKDFRGEGSVGLLVRGLRQGTVCFDAAEREAVGRAGIDAAAAGSEP